MFLVAVYFCSLALSGSWVEGGEPDYKVVNPDSSITSQSLNVGRKLSFRWKQPGELCVDFTCSLWVCRYLSTFLPVCPPRSPAPAWLWAGSQRAELSIRARQASSSGDYYICTIVPLRKVSGECVSSCFYAPEGFHVHSNPLQAWAKAKFPINILK